MGGAASQQISEFPAVISNPDSLWSEFRGQNKSFCAHLSNETQARNPVISAKRNGLRPIPLAI